ncbi:MAG: TPM domain-containing protein, partial [Muribaculaceae bacterium]|nr:TPM domain-containing protein [Muribaculaceae bacterium]
MRIIVTLLTALWTAMAAWAGTYTPAQVPNVHVADHTRHLSNPDGIISAAAQARVDSLVAQLRRETTAEMAVVVVDDIDNPSDIDDFATELFTQWGLGKKDRDNGVLLLVAKNRRKYAIRTGYGVEGVLPDIVCGHIL